MTKQRKLKILFIPIASVGHVNTCIGMAQVLMERGHEVVFYISEQWKSKLVKYGIQEITHLEPGDVEVGDNDPATFWAQRMLRNGLLNDESALQKMINFGKNSGLRVNRNIQLDKWLDQLLPEINPDVIVLDQVVALTSVEKSGIPWVLVCSCNPLFLIEDERTPPGGSGLPCNGNKEIWAEFRKVYVSSRKEDWNKLDEYLKERGAQPLHTLLYINHSPYLNVYPFPLELDYLDIRPLPPNWVQFDNLMRIESQTKFEIPDKLKNKSGKLIFFSMGSMGSADIKMINRLIAILAESKHRFIISKGPLHDRYELPDNMWGQQSVPQIQVLSVVDLFITHGGNNSLTESFFFGKPMIVMPLFVDQYDNAQRIQEKMLGISLDAYRCTKEELLEGIEKLLNDKELNERLKNISKRIQTENSIAKLPELFENLVRDK